MRDVNNGWLLRYTHANVASFFFIFVYLHVARGIYYASFKSPRVLVWSIGCVILILLMAIAFLGYVLPYGQMSLWGATVITNLLSAIPVFGQSLVELIWKYDFYKSFFLLQTNAKKKNLWNNLWILFSLRSPPAGAHLF